MPLTQEDWMKAISHVSDADQLYATVSGSWKGSLLVGALTMICSLVLGPIGLLVGAIIGGIVSYKVHKNSFKPISVVLKDMSEEDKRKLYEEIAHIRAKLQAKDYIELALMLSGKNNLLLKKQLLDVVLEFIKKTFGFKTK